MFSDTEQATLSGPVLASFWTETVEMDSAPTETVQDRMDRVQELAQFTEKCMKQLEKLFHQLGWSPDYQEAPTVS